MQKLDMEKKQPNTENPTLKKNEALYDYDSEEKNIFALKGYIGVWKAQKWCLKWASLWLW